MSAKVIRRCPQCNGTAIYELIWRGVNEPGREPLIYTRDEPYYCDNCDDTFRWPICEELLEARDEEITRP